MTSSNENQPLVSPFATNAGNDMPTGQSFTDAEAQAAEVQAAETPVNPNALIIPTYTVDIAPTMGRLVADQFEHVATLSGAAKLASSAVAPLVAAARGYSTVTPDNLKERAAGLDLKLNTAHGRQLKNVAETGDGLIMPWFSLTAVAQAVTRGEASKSETFQLRPARAVVNAKGKEAKYLQPFGKETVLGVHPATPASWLDSPRVMLAEGLLKADSAFTSHLIAHGVSEETLLNAYRGSAEVARAMLTQAMEAIPEADRILTISVVGSGNWHQMPDWNVLSLKNRDVWVAMDADVASNKAVWNQAYQMKKFLTTKKAGSIGIVTLPPVDGDAKAGLDDFFAFGHSWAELEAAVGDLPTAPEQDLRMELMELPIVNLEAAVTYEMKTREVDGYDQRVPTPLAEAAVVVTGVRTMRSARDGMPVSRAISGEVTWQARGIEGIQRRRFADQPMDTLISPRATATTVLSALTAGRAAGAAVKFGAGQQAVGAWTETISRAEVSEVVKTSGLWENQDGVLGYLTAEGHLTDTGIDPGLRGLLQGEAPAVEIPWVDPSTRAQEIVDAWEQVNAARVVIHAAHNGLWDTVTGMIFAVAVGLQPKGAATLMCGKGSGKSTYLQLISGYYGPAWHGGVALALDGTKPSMRAALAEGNNIIVTVDDAREKNDANATAAVSEVTEEAIRKGYETNHGHKKMQIDETGEWAAPTGVKNLVKSYFITGENLEALKLTPSTVDRLLSFQTTADLPLLRKQGEIGPVLEGVRKTGAMSVLMGAFLVSNLSRVSGAEDQRAELLAPFTEKAKEEAKALAAVENGPTIRAAEFQAPVLAGLDGLNRVVADAYRALGRTAEADALLGTLDGSRSDLVAAWKRHNIRYATEATSTHLPVVNAINAAIATGRAVWSEAKTGAAFDSNTIQIGRKDVKVAGQPDQILLIAQEVAALLSKFGPKIDEIGVKSKLHEITVDPNRTFTLRGESARGIHISREAWDAASGAKTPVEEATAIAVQAAAPVTEAEKQEFAHEPGDFNF